MKTLKQVSEEYMTKLFLEGKDDKTLYTYNKDLQQIKAFFGEDKLVNKIMYPHVAKFLKSDELLKKEVSGEIKDRASQTIKKTIRVFRMLMIYCKKQGYIENLFLTKEIKLGRSKV